MSPAADSAITPSDPLPWPEEPRPWPSGIDGQADIGVLCVHGIGVQAEGETLMNVAAPLMRELGFEGAEVHAGETLLKPREQRALICLVVAAVPLGILAGAIARGDYGPTLVSAIILAEWGRDIVGWIVGAIMLFGAFAVVFGAFEHVREWWDDRKRGARP